MVPTWVKTNRATFAMLATCLTMIALAACSSGPPSAEEIIARSREAMSQLTSYQWSSTHNTVGDGRFGARPVIEQWKETGAARADGRFLIKQFFNPGTHEESSRELITIGDTRIYHFDDGSVYEFSPDFRRDKFNPAGLVDGEGWELVRSTSQDGRDAYVLEITLPDESAEGRLGPTDTRELRTINVDRETYHVLMWSITSETVERLPHGPGPLELHTRRTTNTLLSGFNEPVEIEFPDGFEPAAPP